MIKFKKENFDIPGNSTDLDNSNDNSLNNKDNNINKSTIDPKISKLYGPMSKKAITEAIATEIISEKEDEETGRNKNTPLKLIKKRHLGSVQFTNTDINKLQASFSQKILSSLKERKEKAKKNLMDFLNKTSESFIQKRNPYKNSSCRYKKHRPSFFIEEKDLKKFIKSVQHEFVAHTKEKFDNLYGLSKEYNQEKYKLIGYKKNDSYSLEKYQKNLLNLCGMNTNEELLYGLYRDLKYLHFQSESIKPLPPVNFNALIRSAVENNIYNFGGKNNVDFYRKRKYEKQWKSKVLKVSDLDPYQRELYENTIEVRRFNTKKTPQKSSKIYQLLPEYLVKALERTRNIH